MLHPLDWLERMPPTPIGLLHFFEITKSRNDRFYHSRLGHTFINRVAAHKLRSSPLDKATAATWLSYGSPRSKQAF